MTQHDIEQGRLVCEVGVAPVRPAEFVIVRIGRWTADHESTPNASHDGEGDPPYVRYESIDDCAPLRETIGSARRSGTLVLVTGPNREARGAVAQSLASLSDLRLYRIDLSRVVSKYMSETEKNLGRIFDAAEDSEVVLFFDEAGALFGKRTEVGDGHDRYANVEVGYLVQRIAMFQGLAILATNKRSDFTAPLRRFVRLEVEARLGPSSTSPMLELPQSPDSSPRLGATALSQPSDAELAAACMSWLSVADASSSDVDGLSPPAQGSVADGSSSEFAALVDQMLRTDHLRQLADAEPDDIGRQ